MLDEWRDRDEPLRDLVLWYLALVEFWAGRWDLASDYAEQSREIAVHYATDLPGDHLLPALIALHRGEFTIAKDHARHALSLDTAQFLSHQFAILAICDLWSGNPAESLADFLRAEQAADGSGWNEPNQRWWRADHVDGLLQLGRIDEATGIVAAWEAAAVAAGRERVIAQTVRCRGLIAAALGDLPAAEGLLEKAVDRHGAVGDPFGRGQASLALGVVRLRSRQKRAARMALETALDVFEALGAMSWADAARTELARIGGRQRIEGLSPSERRVAALAAEGRTNREIASGLSLGERTVASHLTHIYAKLGVRSRTELAGYLLSRAGRPDAETSKVQTS
jgi:DNA-binding CsgD family transcriptional regulator